MCYTIMLKDNIMNVKIIEDIGMIDVNGKNRRFYICECPDCKKEFKARADGVNSGRTKTCKSCKAVRKNTTHGDSKSKLHGRWTAMKQRCLNHNDNGYKHYGGRGIEIYASWIENYESYKYYVMSLPNAMKDGYELDRFYNDGNYEPMNVRWITRKEQMSNVRPMESKYIYRFKNRNKSYHVRIKGVSMGYYKTEKEAETVRDAYIKDMNLSVRILSA